MKHTALLAAVLLLSVCDVTPMVMAGLTSDPRTIHNIDMQQKRECVLKCPQGYLPGTCLCQENLFPFIFPSTPCRFANCPAGEICRIEGDKAVCFALAKDTPSVDVCELPAQPGPCKVYIQRYFFDRRDGRCKTFTFGGCQGNGNSFATKEECESTCLVYVPVVTIGGGGETAKSIQSPQASSRVESGSARAEPPSRRQIEVCQLPSERGPCLGSVPSFFFNSASGQCESFIYGGCMGNSNRFNTAQDCELYCRGGLTATQNFRTGPAPVSGLAQGSRVPVFPSLGSGGVPQPPTTTGRYASSNSDCNLDKAPGLCLAYFPSYFYNTQSGRCESFVYGGCQGNANRFESQQQCEQKCMPEASNAQPNLPPACTQPRRVGRCRARIPKWYFDLDSMSCQQFNYGGCGGNNNNFRTQNECQQLCSPTPELASSTGPETLFSGSLVVAPSQQREGSSSSLSQSPNTGSSTKPALCYQSSVVGPCRARMPAYYYDSGRDQCLMFFYGGCSGNENRFNNYDECYAACGEPRGPPALGLQTAASLNMDSPNTQGSNQNRPPFVHICSLERQVGVCKAAMPRFYYNPATGQCERFIYGGCGGNDNNFQSYDNCYARCVRV